jgi:hypothetical protein
MHRLAREGIDSVWIDCVEWNILYMVLINELSTSWQRSY